MFQTRLERLFWAKVEIGPGDECWLWRGAISPQGYGRMSSRTVIPGRQVTFYAHRLAYLWRVGRIPAGYQIDHLCHVRTCVRPDHLEAVTQRTNSQRLRSHQGLSRFRGVTRQGNSWIAQVKVGGKNIRRGSFEREEDAAVAAAHLRAKHLPGSIEAMTLA